MTSVVFAAAFLGGVELRLRFVTAQNGNHSIADVAPAGWRRTINGWERAEDWAAMTSNSQRSINQWIAFQHAYEPVGATSLLDRISSVHPLVYSAILLTFVLAIVISQDPSFQASFRPAESSRKSFDLRHPHFRTNRRQVEDLNMSHVEAESEEIHTA